jgi:hypothetical protein
VEAGHAGEVSGVCVDGDHAVTSSWDTQLRIWDAPTGAPKKMFDKVQRIQAHEAPITAVARVAQGYVISGDVAGTCKVFTRNSGEPLFEHPPLEEEAGAESNGGEAAAPAPAPAADAAAAQAEEGEPPASHADATAEDEELRVAAEAKAALEAEYAGPWTCVGSFTAAVGGIVNAIAVGLCKLNQVDP